jgi:DNA-binding NarL/FixJ family response regulator
MRIAIIEDNNKYRECLEKSLKAFPDCEVVISLANALNIETQFWANTPDLALVDVNMPGLDGIEALKTINKHFPQVQCIILTISTDFNTVLRSMQNGAKGYLVKDKDSIQKIVESLRVLYNGNYHEEFPLNGTLANKVLQHFMQREKTLDEKLDEFRLTSRQKEVLKLLYEGKTYKEIAEACVISIDTLNSHIKSIYPKLNVRSRGEIVNILKS